jgi:menaquinone-dependent protoporphyrinogen oxidase
MHILIAYASRHGSTKEIAEAIANTLRLRGIAVDVSDVVTAGRVNTYDAVILGSAVYAGHWMSSAVTFATIYRSELASRPTWLFSSGPIGMPRKPDAGKAVQLEHALLSIGARGHRVFAGKIDKRTLTFGEHALFIALRGQEGDFRDWNEINSWAASVADALVNTKG